MDNNKNWIYWQKFNSDEAVSVGSYYNISNYGNETVIFISEVTKPKFQRSEIVKNKIGFNISNNGN